MLFGTVFPCHAQHPSGAPLQPPDPHVQGGCPPPSWGNPCPLPPTPGLFVGGGDDLGPVQTVLLTAQTTGERQYRDCSTAPLCGGPCSPKGWVVRSGNVGALWDLETETEGLKVLAGPPGGVLQPHGVTASHGARGNVQSPMAVLRHHPLQGPPWDPSESLSLPWTPSDLLRTPLGPPQGPRTVPSRSHWTLCTPGHHPNRNASTHCTLQLQKHPNGRNKYKFTALLLFSA